MSELPRNTHHQGEPPHPLTVKLYTMRNLAEFTGITTEAMGAALLANSVSRKTVEFALDKEARQ